MYAIIGADGRPYGPATAEQIREWIASGRANGQTMAQVEGAAESKPLSAFPEFADALANEIVARDYTLDIFSCLDRAWEKVQSDFWPIIGVSTVALLLLGAAGSAGVG